ncbi:MULTISPECIES: undecaprenyl-phosphate glucose phosphotransferase [Raoultella]|jgi:putative colanic acid biosynthesis UDP-glucose lipid carrier transferase|uniref:undecaprenyl-phosphate glucose phosphotransferase n=1 Tax=Raoultella TaxID=160674 RepID=UPI0004E330C4|nr:MULTISPECIES: undecaprenyl-phosphate glucose phosphotransferase [Raoultella]KFD02513.1 capsular polysaccharide sugar transferase [Raoultella planticola ATCC 33531]MBZ7830499.1 undecaprenyl-phosphate glucose phosphotransferase [Raoultella planticola]TCL52539.1 putative colanic acid biosynthesis UDP-glucose lipid carrier transferase [Raoultella planticola]UNK76861.1 undecaprenyl-phosphate glucose phosphotransferase [Raoultella planticola]WPJ19046.1 undecaprenyl-phosphate glucose phosphotransf
MADSKIKIYNVRYSKLMKLLDFFTVNALIFIYLKYFYTEPSTASALLGVIYSLIFIHGNEYFRLYASQFRENLLRKSVSLFLSVCLSSLLSFIFFVLSEILLNKHSTENTLLLAKALSQCSIIIFSSVLVVRLIIRCFFNRKKLHVAILGITPAGLAIEQALLHEFSKKSIEISYFEDRNIQRDSRFINIEQKGNSRDLLALAKADKVDEIYIALPMVAQQRIRQFLNEFSDTTVDVFLVPDLFSYSSHISQLRMFGNIQTISIFTSPFDGDGALLKRIEDIILGTFFTLLSLPAMLLIAIGIKLTSPGPVLFKQNRYGLNGKQIQVWKFRTMRVMENNAVVKQATRGDPRVTRFGAFLRRTSLDELPQFINVLQGRMSIVGPRPHAVAHNEEYRVLVDNYMIRHKVKPGITGLAQISGFRGETDTLDKMEKRIHYDLEYIQSWSLFLDLKIIFLTFFRGFVGKNAF